MAEINGGDGKSLRIRYDSEPWDNGSMEPNQWIHGTKSMDPWNQINGSMEPNQWIHGTKSMDPWNQINGSMEPNQWIHGTKSMDPWNQINGSMEPNQWIHGTKSSKSTPPMKSDLIFWSNYCDLTRPISPQMVVESKGILLFQGNLGW